MKPLKKGSYRSYNRFPVCPVTIRCKGMKFKEATVLSAGFGLFGPSEPGVSAYITLKNGTLETASELISILDQTMSYHVSLLERADPCGEFPFDYGTPCQKTWRDPEETD